MKKCFLSGRSFTIVTNPKHSCILKAFVDSFLTNQFTTFHILNQAPQNIVFLLKAVLVNPFPLNVLILNPLKTSEIVRFAHFSRGYKLGILGRNRLM